jgi:hypothetical protein
MGRVAGFCKGQDQIDDHISQSPFYKTGTLHNTPGKPKNASICFLIKVEMVNPMSYFACTINYLYLWFYFLLFQLPTVNYSSKN